jgi:hypothetical protein
LGHTNYSSININNFFLQKPWNSIFSLTVEFDVFTALFINIRVLCYMVNQHGNIYKRLQTFLKLHKVRFFYKTKDNVTISYHSWFLLNSTLLFP